MGGPLSSTTTTMSSDETPPPSYERDNSRSPKAHIEGHGAGKPYKPHDVITETTQAAIVSFVAASFLAGLKNSFSKQNLGVTGVLTPGAHSGISHCRAHDVHVRTRRDQQPHWT